MWHSNVCVCQNAVYFYVRVVALYIFIHPRYFGKMTNIMTLKMDVFIRVCYNTCVAVLVTYGCNFNASVSKCRVFLMLAL